LVSNHLVALGCGTHRFAVRRYDNCEFTQLLLCRHTPVTIGLHFRGEQRQQPRRIAA
jgi:hypothetical protein